MDYFKTGKLPIKLGAAKF